VDTRRSLQSVAPQEVRVTADLDLRRSARRGLLSEACVTDATPWRSGVCQMFGGGGGGASAGGELDPLWGRGIDVRRTGGGGMLRETGTVCRVVHVCPSNTQVHLQGVGGSIPRPS